MIQSVLCAVEVAETVIDTIAEFKALWLPIAWFFAWWLKNKTYIDNGTIPIVVVALCAVGQSLATMLAGDPVTLTTVMAGIAWGVGAVGAHSGFKNVTDLIKRVILGRG